MVEIKICGLNDEASIATATAAGADRIGLLFYPRSPRNVSLERAGELARQARRIAGGRVRIVAVSVDADDELIEAIVTSVAPDDLQLHGSESVARVAELKARTGCGIIKAAGIASGADLERAAVYSGVADLMLYDAKPAPEIGADLPGGNGLSFDWRVLAGLAAGERYLLSGGLHADNVATALALTGAPGVDVSSGVESAPGRKDPERIRAFISAVRAFEASGRTTVAASANTPRT